MGRSVTFFPVGNGNMSVIQIDDFTMVFDLNASDEKTTWELLKPLLRVEDDKFIIDVLCISHGDKDHCGGFKELARRLKNKTLVIGSIWHSGHDRTDSEEETDLPEDYMKFREEIIRRNEFSDAEFGDIVIPLMAGDDETFAFEGLECPDEVEVRVISPHTLDVGEEDHCNDTSVVMRLTVSGLPILYCGDVEAAVWQERIIPQTLAAKGAEEWAKASILVASHHGSYTFFGSNRDDVRDADPHPDNYEALTHVSPEYLVISACAQFPCDGDESGDQPPHYASWKWYHKWFRDNRSVKKTDKHPDRFKYTADGYIRLELQDDGSWVFVDGWAPDDEGNGGDGGKGGSTVEKGFKYDGGTTKRPGGHYAKK